MAVPGLKIQGSDYCARFFKRSRLLARLGRVPCSGRASNARRGPLSSAARPALWSMTVTSAAQSMESRRARKAASGICPHPAQGVPRLGPEAKIAPTSSHTACEPRNKGVRFGAASMPGSCADTWHFCRRAVTTIRAQFGGREIDDRRRLSSAKRSLLAGKSQTETIAEKRGSPCAADGTRPALPVPGCGHRADRSFGTICLPHGRAIIGPQQHQAAVVAQKIGEASGSALGCIVGDPGVACALRHPSAAICIGRRYSLSVIPSPRGAAPSGSTSRWTRSESACPAPLRVPEFAQRRQSRPANTRDRKTRQVVLPHRLR